MSLGFYMIIIHVIKNLIDQSYGIFTFLGLVFAQSEPKVSDALAKLPDELQGKVNETQIKEIQEKSTQIFKERCEKNGGANAFSNVEVSHILKNWF